MTPRDVWHLGTRHVGRRVHVFDRLDSTSNVAAGLAGSDDADGTAVLADEQTVGRGQHGRTWTCPAGGGVLMSVLLFPPPPLSRPAVLTAWAAVSVCDTVLDLTGLRSRIKWPNDVLIQGRKVCGILIETKTASASRRSLATVCGIGLNVNQTADDFAAAELPEAASLAVFTGQRRDCYEVARRLLHHLDARYDALCAGDLASLEAAWRGHLGLMGQPVVAECADGPRRGLLRGLTWDGVELVRTDGTEERLRPEAVLHLSPA
ncbi:MAG TPA: biotin--[acetyl-CoA-carboxylase] ligase [Gemmataceae bacterium]|nr:biotin--[acetyl-CoA-carboxylase] ligase [Gemmataceae bacterium]